MCQNFRSADIYTYVYKVEAVHKQISEVAKGLIGDDTDIEIVRRRPASIIINPHL